MRNLRSSASMNVCALLVQIDAVEHGDPVSPQLYCDKGRFASKKVHSQVHSRSETNNWIDKRTRYR